MGKGIAIAEKCGFHITRARNTLKAKRIEVLSRLNTNAVLDVGANSGQWSSELRDSGYRGRIIAFEPASGPFAALKSLSLRDSKLEAINTALGQRDGEGLFRIHRQSENSSFRATVNRQIYPSQSGIADEVLVPIRRLDSLLSEITSEQDRFYLKIDTQGFEREVLIGAHETLSRIDAVEVELSLIELYEGQALLPEVWHILTKANFRPAWVERGYRDRRDIWLLQLDGLFIRESAWNSRHTLGSTS